MTVPVAIPIIEQINELASHYSAWLVDIWGVMHNGRRAFPGAVEAARAFRKQGGIVVLLSNSPRPSPSVQEQLRHLGVPDQAYDATVTSGDLTRHELGKHEGATVYHLGPERDRPIFHGLPVKLGPPEEAALIVCSGLFDDETETPDDYVERLRALASARGVSLHFPRLEFCTDNAAMIAAAGLWRLKAGQAEDLQVQIHARWPLSDLASPDAAHRPQSH